jgi:hypothetical protein
MKNMVYCFLCNLLLIALIMLTSCGRHDEIMTIVPAPVYMQQEAGCFVIDEGTCISVEDASQKQVAGWFAGLFEAPAGFVPELTQDNPYAGIRLFNDVNLPEESYRLYVDKENIENLNTFIENTNGETISQYAMENLSLECDRKNIDRLLNEAR